MKKTVTLALGLTMAAVFAAGTAVPVLAEDNPVTFTCWYDEDDMEGIIQAINDELGGAYTVDYFYVAQSDYNNVLSTQLAAGEGPDIVADGTNFPARIKSGAVEELTGADYLGEFNEAGFALCSDGEKVYGIPSYGWFSGICYWIIRT